MPTVFGEVDLFPEEVNLSPILSLADHQPTHLRRASVPMAVISIDAHRRAAQEYAKMIRCFSRELDKGCSRKNVLKKFTESKEANLHQLVKEEELKGLGAGFGALLSSLFTPPDMSRRLKPKRREIVPRPVRRKSRGLIVMSSAGSR
jgi:hypothetical protein